MSAIINLGNEWPFPRVSDARRAGEPTWFATTEARAEEFRDVVPPGYFRRDVPASGFFCGEPAAHDDRGVAIHAAFVRIGERWYVREVAVDSLAAAVAELHAALRPRERS